MSETLPFAFPGYQIEGLIGRGGMGSVYRAVQLATRRPVAIKLLSHGVAPERMAVFRREAATLAQMEHPHIVPLYDYGEHEGVPYLVVRFLGGGTVADRLKSGPIEADLALHWISDVAEALDAAHRRGITHRDVKPSNLLLDEAGNVYLGDFGIAGTTVDLAAAPHSGSAAYASPEQARGEAPDARSDVYSLAATAFEMLTGQKPYEAETALGMMVRHMHDPVPSARALAPALSAEADAALASGMAKRPQDRPPSAGAFARSLVAASPAAGETVVEATPPSAPARRPSRILIVGLGLVLVAACLGGLGILGGGLGALLASSSQTTPTPRPTTVPRPSPTAAPFTAAAVPFTDDFSDPTSGFGTTNPEVTEGSVAYTDGTLQITVWTPGIELFSPYQGLDEQDLQIGVEASLLSGPPGSEMGIACRWQDEANHIGASLRGDDMISLWKKTDGITERWQDWTPVTASGNDPAAPRILQLVCAGSEIRFAVDGTVVATATDPSPGRGSLALLGGLLEPGEAALAFDQLQVDRP
jgi:serine/threonine protein kinase